MPKTPAAHKTPTAKTTPVKPANPAEIALHLSEASGITRDQARVALKTLADLAREELVADTGAGEFTIPGIVRLQRATRPATKARRGVNPRTLEPMEIAARPAKSTVKATPVKALRALD